MFPIENSHSIIDIRTWISNHIQQWDHFPFHDLTLHCDDVIMTTIASQIPNLAVVYSTVYSDANQRKHQSSASLAFVRGIHRDRWIPRTKGQLRGKCFHLMTSSWIVFSSTAIWVVSNYHLRPNHGQSLLERGPPHGNRMLDTRDVMEADNCRMTWVHWR